MATLDSSIVNIALPTLTHDLNSDLYRVKWVVIVYLLVVTCLLLPFGRLSDQYGRKRVFQTGFFIFTLGSVFCGLSDHLTTLVLARMVQGLGVAMLMANGPAIITAAFPSTERGTALGTLAMVVSGGLLSGPGIGGILITHLGWRSIFWVNLPIGILGMILVQKSLNRDAACVQREPFDWGGTALQVVLFISFIVLFDPPNVSISGSLPFPISRWLVATFVLIIGAIFLKVESQVRAPVFDLSLLKNRTFCAANLASFFLFVAFSSVSVLMPFFLEIVLHFSTKKAGLFMTAIPLTVFVVAPISGRLSDRVGSSELSIAGTLVGALGLFAMAGLFGAGMDAAVTPGGIVLGLASIGLATGLFQSPNNNSIMGSVPPNKLGVASAFLATVRNLGLVTGTGLATSLFTWRMMETGNFVSSIHFTHCFAGGVGLLAMIASLGKRRERGYGLETERESTHS